MTVAVWAAGALAAGADTEGAALVGVAGLVVVSLLQAARVPVSRTLAVSAQTRDGAFMVPPGLIEAQASRAGRPVHVIRPEGAEWIAPARPDRLSIANHPRWRNPSGLAGRTSGCDCVLGCRQGGRCRPGRRARRGRRAGGGRVRPPLPGPGVRVGGVDHPRPGPGPGRQPGGVRAGLAGCGQLRRAPGLGADLAADHHPQRGDRRGPGQSIDPDGGSLARGDDHRNDART